MPTELTVTALLENVFAAKDRVAREISGFIPSVLINTGTEGVSIGGTVTSHRTAEPTLNTSYTPAMTIPEGDTQTVSADTVTIDQVANVQIPLTGEIERQIRNTGGEKILIDMQAQAIRKIVNAIETHIGLVAYKGASRAAGTAGTTPFASNHNLVNSVRQILVTENGCPNDGDISLILSGNAGTNFRNLSTNYKVNEAGGDDLLRRGVLVDISGIKIRESAYVASHTKGTGTSYQTNGAVAANATTVNADTGSGTLIQGDVITFAADSNNKYVVGTTLAGGVLSLNRPGARVAIADNNAITIGNDYTANVMFHRSAIELVMRPPSQPFGGDAAVDSQIIQDPVTGLVFRMAIYKGYGKAMIDFTTLYKAKVWKPEFVATLLG